MGKCGLSLNFANTMVCVGMLWFYRGLNAERAVRRKPRWVAARIAQLPESAGAFCGGRTARK